MSSAADSGKTGPFTVTGGGKTPAWVYIGALALAAIVAALVLKKFFK